MLSTSEGSLGHRVHRNCQGAAKTTLVGVPPAQAARVDSTLQIDRDG